MTAGNRPLLSNAARTRQSRPVDRDVVEALVNATARLLRQKSRGDITIREIALESGFNSAMIHYYFQSKSNLFMVFIDHLADGYLAAMEQLEIQFEELDPHVVDHTRLLVSAIVEVYTKNADALRLLIAEIQMNSELKNAYTQRHASRVTKIVKRVIKRLVQRGIYREDLDISLTAFTLETLLTQHVVQSGVMKAAFDLDPGPATNSAWVDHLVSTLGPGLRSPIRY